MAFDLPRNRMLPVNGIDIVHDTAPHPFQIAEAVAIDANWRREVAANPALFDGEVMLFSQLRWDEGLLSGRCHGVRFATYMHWRRSRPAGAEHLFGHAMPVSTDGALIAIQMADHTANPGRVYFAAGSLDRSDVDDGIVDIAGNMRREVMEETGIDLGEYRCDPTFHGWSSERGTVLVRRYFLDRSAAEIVARINAFAARDPQSEIARAIAIAAPGDLPASAMPHMRPLTDWHFGLLPAYS